MKKLIYVCLIALLALSVGCEKEELNTENDTTQFQNRNSSDLENSENLYVKVLDTKSSDNLNQGSQGRGVGFGGDGFGGDVNIYDGTNYNDGPPNGIHSRLLITYSPLVTELQKREYRVQYQVTGELWYFEQCPNDPQKEIWYFVFAGSDIPCQLPWPMSCLRGDTPPQSPPNNFCTIQINQTCDD